MSKQMENIEKAFHTIAQNLRTGKFTKAEMDGISLLAQAVINATNKAIERGATKDV